MAVFFSSEEAKIVLLFTNVGNIDITVDNRGNGIPHLLFSYTVGSGFQPLDEGRDFGFKNTYGVCKRYRFYCRLASSGGEVILVIHQSNSNGMERRV